MATHSSILAWKARGAWWATVLGITKSNTTEHARMRARAHTHTHTHTHTGSFLQAPYLEFPSPVFLFFPQRLRINSFLVKFYLNRNFYPFKVEVKDLPIEWPEFHKQDLRRKLFSTRIQRWLYRGVNKSKLAWNFKMVWTRKKFCLRQRSGPTSSIPWGSVFVLFCHQGHFCGKVWEALPWDDLSCSVGKFLTRKWMPQTWECLPGSVVCISCFV